MIVTFRYLQREKSGRLSYRRKFPKELVSYIPSGSPTGRGRVEFKVSLRSSSINDPAARARYDDAEREFGLLVARANRLATQSYDPLDGALVKFLADTYVHDHLESDENMRWRREHRPARYVTRGHPEDVYCDCREMLEDYDAQGLVDFWKDWALQFSEAVGFYLSPNDPGFADLCRALGEAACTVWLGLDKRIDRVPVETPDRPDKEGVLRGGATAPKGSAGSPLSILELFERYAAVPGRNPKTVAQWRPYIRHLIEYLGSDDVNAITHSQLVSWRTYLRDKQTYRGARLTAKTINGSYMGAVNAVLAWAKGDDLIPTNPMLEVAKVKLPKVPTTRSKGFTNDEALLILKATLEPVSSREGAHLRNAKRWCPWLMAYSGARVNEITQLRKEDIYQQDGIWVMRITPEAGRVKSKAFRLVPLHSHLIDQGFLRFVDSRPDGPLFFDPDKRRSDHAINRQSNRLGSKLASWVRSLGIDGVMPNHAWRHHFTTAEARHGLDPRVAKAITGHATSDVHDKTYMASLSDHVDLLSRELEKIPRFKVA